eukprot:m.334633 g.334633  ORF g.334633 m.334633 type:complete len:428 (-) comp20509_c0_seq8:755-2038(-)
MWLCCRSAAPVEKTGTFRRKRGPVSIGSDPEKFLACTMIAKYQENFMNFGLASSNAKARGWLEEAMQPFQSMPRDFGSDLARYTHELTAVRSSIATLAGMRIASSTRSSEASTGNRTDRSCSDNGAYDGHGRSSDGDMAGRKDKSGNFLPPLSGEVSAPAAELHDYREDVALDTPKKLRQELGINASVEFVFDDSEESKALEKRMRASRRKRWTSFRRSSSSSLHHIRSPNAAPEGPMRHHTQSTSRGSVAHIDTVSKAPPRIGKLSTKTSAKKPKRSSSNTGDSYGHPTTEVARRVGTLGTPQMIPGTGKSLGATKERATGAPRGADVTRAQQLSQESSQRASDDGMVLVNDLPREGLHALPAGAGGSPRSTPKGKAVLTDTLCVVNDISSVKPATVVVPVKVSKHPKSQNRDAAQLIEVTSETLM